MKFTSPYKHIKRTSTWGTILDKNWLETGSKTPVKQPRVIHTESGREGRETMLGPVSQEGTEEKGDYTCRDPPWGVSSSRHIYGARVLVFKRSPLVWLVGQWYYRRAMESLDSAQKERACVWILSNQGGDSRLKLCRWLTHFLLPP